MKVVDANIMIYAVDAESAHHDRARSWFEACLSGSETIAFAWAAMLVFVRITTNPRIFVSPLDVDVAFDLVDAWLGQPCTTVIHPGDRHAAILRELLEDAGTAGNLTTDAHLAALAIEHGAQLCSTDSDFTRFTGLQSLNPLT